MWLTLEPIYIYICEYNVIRKILTFAIYVVSNNKKAISSEFKSIKVHSVNFAHTHAVGMVVHTNKKTRTLDSITWQK